MTNRPRLMLLCTVIGVVVVLAPQRPALAKLRPLARAMLENLASVDQIWRGVALDDYELAERAALRLRNQAKNLRRLDVTFFGLNAEDDNRFDHYLTLQLEAANAIAQAAKQKNAMEVLERLQVLSRTACVACHKEFREPAKLLRPAVLHMMNFLNAWREINRGLAINDFGLVERQANEIAALGETLDPGPVIEKTFGIDKAPEQEAFRAFLRSLTRNARAMEQAAAEEDQTKMTEAMRDTWQQGCVPCHQVFR